MADEGINTKKPDKAALKKIKADDEKGFLKEIKKKNKGFYEKNITPLSFYVQ